MSYENDPITEIVTAIRGLSDEARSRLNENHSYNYHPEMHEVMGLILHHKGLGEIDWNATSDELNSENWSQEESLKGRSVNDLRAIMYNHSRTERFARGHIQDLVASGYLDKWADALEAAKE